MCLRYIDLLSALDCGDGDGCPHLFIAFDDRHHNVMDLL